MSAIGSRYAHITRYVLGGYILLEVTGGIPAVLRGPGTRWVPLKVEGDLAWLMAWGIPHSRVGAIASFAVLSLNVGGLLLGGISLLSRWRPGMWGAILGITPSLFYYLPGVPGAIALASGHIRLAALSRLSEVSSGPTFAIMLWAAAVWSLVSWVLLAGVFVWLWREVSKREEPNGEAASG